MMLRNRHMRIGLVLILGLLFGGELLAEEWAVVKHVLDGDTVILKDGRRIRYIGIDAPEIDHGDKKAEPYGYASKEHNEKIVLSKRVRLEYAKQKTDQYGRQLAHVFLADGRFVNAEMLEKGLAWCMADDGGGRYAPVLLNAQRSAMSSTNGLWELPRLKDNHRYVGNRRTLRFHDESCAFGKRIGKNNRIRFTSKWEAFYEGHSPCAKCMPRLAP